MLSKILSSAVMGIDAYVVEVETDLFPVLPAFAMVGLPDNAVQESKERVQSAIKNSGYLFPNKKITINLAPADIKKEGSSYDLAIAVGILDDSGQISKEKFHEYIILGEVTLDGSLRPIHGTLSMAISAFSNGVKGMNLTQKHAKEAAMAFFFA